ncbi:heparan-alpha-glucosaminide N-acetyltransferase domain-containing protein [Nocardioides sp. InS609-2]|uniref:heparan-alpha-glucosaminide N-acetyltransferase domain-containing protein n=1 Tax=Nocardioides sp. InS609-2 TaxID=2760705 RepID=UPI0020BDAD00|nr:heparan-alpha-glucosaminide N-acetyltransferase domain-containing protein [Nocardioides sp. InS609-2]
MTAPASRIVGVDVARCLALLGMMATHILATVTAGGESSTSHVIASGRASGLFALLAGVSLALVTGGSTPHHGRRLMGERAGIVVRALLIGFIGLLLGALPTNIAIILVYYAVLFVMALPFLGLGWRPLGVLALVWAVAGPAVSLVLRDGIESPTRIVPSFEHLVAPGDLAQSLLLTGYYPAMGWFAYLLAGLAIGRLDLRRLAIAARLAVVGVAVAAVTWLVSADLTRDAAVRRALLTTDEGGATTWSQLRMQLDQGSYGTTPTGSWWWLVPIGPHSGTSFTLLHTIGCSMAVLGVAVLAARVAPRAWSVLFGAGAMTLTLYSLHIVLLTPEIPPKEIPSSYLPQVVVVLLTGAAYALARHRGPLETLVGSLSKATAESRWLRKAR